MDVDQDLMYTRKQMKENLMKDIKEIPRNGEILNMEPFPSPLTLALLARAVYAGGAVPLPEGWTYLTTAFNKSRGNGYFGAAYWNPELQQVVVAHRGTELSNSGALWTNYKGVVNTEYTTHMNSAITFADQIMTVLRQVNEEKGAGLQLSLTGHSLGGWLAQVTAFTLEHARRAGGRFVRRPERPPGRRARAVTFDTPGCGDMLDKIIDDGYCRHRKTVHPDRLDIVNYLAPPNRINTAGSHVGTIHLVRLDVSHFGKLSKDTSWYNIAIHRIDNFVKAFEGGAAVREVLDWPVSGGALGGPEYGEFHKRTSHAADYALNPVEEERQHETWIKEVRYKTEDETASCNLRVFSEGEVYLLNLWSALRAEGVKMTDISAFVKRQNLGTVDALFADFETDIKNRTVTCQSRAILQTLVRRTKQLMRWFHPELLEAVELQTARVPRAGPLVYRTVARNYLDSVPECHVRFEDTIGLNAFLESSETRILHITTENSQFEVARLYNLLSRVRELPLLGRAGAHLRRDRQTFLDWDKMRDLDRTVDFESLYRSGYSRDDLLVLDAAAARPDPRIFKRFLNEVHKKLIFISSSQSDYSGFLESLNVPFECALRARVGLADLTEESQKELFSRKMLIVNEKQFALEDYTSVRHASELLAHIDSYIERLMFKGIVTDKKFTIKTEDALLSQDDLKVHSTLNREVSVARIVRAVRKHSGETLLVISGIGREDLDTDRWKELALTVGDERIFTTAGDGESIFKRMCREKPASTVYWLESTAESVYCKIMYEEGFYMKRRYHQKIIFCLERFACSLNIQKAIFVFQNVKDKRSLLRELTISEVNKSIFVESKHICSAASAEEADDIVKQNPDAPVHVLMQEVNGGPILWQRSRGSLEGLRPYVTAYVGESTDERELRDTAQKVVIIADEPGMGKTTSLTSASRLLRSARRWVIKVDLKDFQIPIRKLPADLTLDSVCKLILRDEDSLLRGLLQLCLDKQNRDSRDVYFLFDGFDEIKRDLSATEKCAEDEVLRLLKYLNSETAARIWVTARPHRREMLENAFSTFAMRFEKITENQQREYLVKFWRPHLLLELDSYGDAEERKLEKCAEYLYENAKRVLGDDIQNFMGIPLQMRMLAEVFMRRVKFSVESDSDIENTFDVKSVLNLYQQFVSLKYEIYFGDKTGLNAGLSGELKHSTAELLTEKHRLLGLRTIFPEFAKENFDNPEDGWGAELCRVGLVQAGGENVELVHRTLAEYFCADLAVRWLRKRGRYHGHAPVLELLLSEILLRGSHNVIRIFINNLVLSRPLSEDADKFSALKISELWRNKQRSLFGRDRCTALHVGVREGNAGIIDFLVGGFKCEPVQLIGFLAAHDRDGGTALGLAARAAADAEGPDAIKYASRDIMKKFVRSVEPCPYEVILELLLATYVTFLLPEKIKVLGDYLGEAVCPEIRRAFIRTEKIMREDVPRFLAAVRGSRAAEVQELYRQMENDTERRCVLLAPDGRWGETALHIAARDRHSEELNKIQTEIIRIVCDRNIPEVGRSYDRYGRTPLHWAAEAGRLDAVEHLVTRGVHIDSLSVQHGETALFSAAHSGSLPVVEYLVGKGSDINILNADGENVLFCAARGGSLPVVRYFLNKGMALNIVSKAGTGLRS